MKGEVPAVGTIIKQPELAQTLTALAEQGPDGFYKGAVAKRMVEGVRKLGGIWSLEDFADYRVVERKPLYGEYRGARIVSAPPPSSGGVAIIDALNILSGFDLSAVDSATRKHLVVEAMRRAHRDRAEFLGDPDFVKVPTERLTHPYYADGQRASIRMDRATPSDMLPSIEAPSQGPQTSHFSIIDTEGNRVAGTQSINFFFGSGLMVPGTGVMLNNEMDDFAAKPGVPNGFRLVGADANAIAPGKRPLSSMTPTFVEKPDGLMIVGSPGGSVHHDRGAARRRSTGWTACRPRSSSRRAAITTSTCPTRSRSSRARSPKKKSRRCRSTATRCASRACRATRRSSRGTTAAAK